MASTFKIGEARPTPQNSALGFLSQYLNAARSMANKVPLPELLGGGVGNLLLGESPEEVERWSYGDYPYEIPSESNIPQAKSLDRIYGVVDALGAVPLVTTPARAAAAIPGALKHGALEFMKSIGTTPSYVIKPKGGNWLTGGVEDALSGLKQSTMARGVERIPLEHARNWPGLADRANKELALNNWIDKQLTRYIKNEMATPEDPVRALAERGVLHFEPDINNATRSAAALRRSATGNLAGGLGESDLARNWELASDASVTPLTVNDLIGPGGSARYRDATLAKDPWLAKLPPEQMVYKEASVGDDLGFSHLIDELRNAVNPQSGLPPELLLKYDSLPRVSVPQAVERVAKINEWRAAQKAEADAALAMNPATHLVKEYPEGYRWVELRQGSELPEGWREVRKPSGEVGAYYDPSGATVYEHPSLKVLQDALKYEGDTMGHCVGGYCDDVASGRSRIFSLRDAKGQPHTTIEVKPKGAVFSDVAKHIGREEAERLLDQGITLKEMIENIPDFKYPQSVIQVKGKGNAKPKEEYIPFVQDFIRTQGPWSDVGDLANTDLVDLRNLGNEPFLQRLRDRYKTEYLTKDEWDNPDIEGYARGGPVQTGFNAADIDARADALAAELGL